MWLPRCCWISARLTARKQTWLKSILVLVELLSRLVVLQVLCRFLDSAARLTD